MSAAQSAAGPAVATLNLYHWAAPGIGWYDPEVGHTAESWAAKRAWLAAILAEMDADVVGFQEVVSIEALREICQAAGYPHLATVAEPRIREADDGSGRRLYVRPVQAVAARAAMTAAAVEPAAGVSTSLGLSQDRAFRRPAIRVETALPGLGPVVIYCCHLKSPGVGVEDALMAGFSEPPDEPGARARWTLEALSRAHGAAVIQRVFEASALYHAAAADIAAEPERAVMIVGDLNDGPDSPALAALTPHRAFERDGGAGEGADMVEAALERYRLVDAYRLSPRRLLGDRRPATHRSGASGEAIDFVLVSQPLRPGEPGARARRIDWRAHDAHFRRADPVISSDHAGVSARFDLL